MTTKQDREREFHNAAFSDERRRVVAPAYAIVHDSRTFYEQAIRSRSRGARVLEYGCGASAFVAGVVDDAGELVGIDISDVAVMQATERAAREGRTAHYQVMDAESLDFPDRSFDLVCSTAVLHHLDLRKAFREISRTLRPGGHAIFMEPLGHNPLINWYRRATPDLRTTDEHPLLMSDLALAAQYFDSVDVHFFVMFSLAAALLRKTRIFRPVLYRLEALDRLIFRYLPWTRKYAWQVVLVPIRAQDGCCIDLIELVAPQSRLSDVSARYANNRTEPKLVERRLRLESGRSGVVAPIW